jgi:molybdopterin-guanine dinucleotide biosynthesis protein A
MGQGTRIVPASLNTQIAGVILAGGKSTRMGTHKALMSYRGARLIDHISDTMKDTNLSVYVSGNIAPFICIPDLIEDIGPLGGIISSVDFLRTQCIKTAIFVPVDMPYMNSQLLTQLLHYWNGQDAIHFSNHPLPRLLNFSPEVICVVNNIKMNPVRDRSIRGLISQLNSYVCSPSDDAEKKALTNVNTPQDWKQIQDIKSNDEY